jgi:predicted RecA/RadA family phage recombinase
MAKGTYIQKGKTIDYKNGGEAAIEYKEVIPLVTRIGIAGENIAVDATGSAETEGVYELPAVNNAAFAVGDQLYWDATAGKLTKTSEGNTAAGWCTEVKAEAGTVARVKIG